MEAQSERVTRCMHVFFFFLHVRLPTCMRSRCFATKIPATELRRELAKSALLVGSVERISGDEGGREGTERVRGKNSESCWLVLAKRPASSFLFSDCY